MADAAILEFWATVCLSVLSVTMVCCGQTHGWIKMKFGTEVGLGPGHIVLEGTQLLLPNRVTAPNFRPMSVVAKRLNGLRCHLKRWQTSAQATLC